MQITEALWHERTVLELKVEAGGVDSWTLRE